MSTRRGAHYLKVTLVLVVLAAVPAALLSVPPAVLVVEEHDTGKILFHKGMKINETFTLAYIHSITKQPVHEVFYVKDSRTLALKEMRYDSFGSNLPVGPEKLAQETTEFYVEDGFYKIIYENRTFDRVPVMVGQVVADHALVFTDESRLRFLDVTEGGTYIDFYVKPFLNFLINRISLLYF